MITYHSIELEDEEGIVVCRYKVDHVTKKVWQLLELDGEEFTYESNSFTYDSIALKIKDSL